MAVNIQMPKLGLTMTEGKVAKWHKLQGDDVKHGDLLFEVETDKLTNEVFADCEGVLLKILADEGDVVPCTGIVAYIGQPGESFEDGQKAVEPQSIQPQSIQIEEKAAKSREQAHHTPVEGVILASPAAKKLAREKGFDLHKIPASGPNGAIVRKDVENYRVKPSSAAAREIANELGINLTEVESDGRIMAKDVLLTAVRQTTGIPEKDERIPMNSMRKTIAARMSNSWLSSPRVWYETAVDMTNAQRLRNELKPIFKEKGINLTYTHIIILAAARTLAEYPQFNASLDGDTLLLHPHVHMGLAVSLDDGLLVPNIKCCEKLSLSAIAEQTQDLIQKARTNQLPLDAYQGGTFTITNIGNYGTRSFSPIINQPELAILGVAAIVDTPVALDGEVVIRPMMNLGLVADHRVIDGAKGAAFLKRVAQYLELPSMLL